MLIFILFVSAKMYQRILMCVCMYITFVQCYVALVVIVSCCLVIDGVLCKLNWVMHWPLVESVRR